MTVLDDLLRNYRIAFLRYVGRREEAALAAGYELGRTAVASGVSILELAQVHHAVFLEILRDSTADDLPGITAAASEFLLEVLATYDMAQRSLLERTQGDGPTTGSR